MKTSCAESSEKNYRLSIRKYEKEAVELVAVRARAEKRTSYIELTDGRIIGFPR